MQYFIDINRYCNKICEDLNIISYKIGYNKNMCY